MQFYPITGTKIDNTTLSSLYKEVHAIGVLRIAENCLFFRVKLKTYYIPYTDIHRIFRRVLLVDARMCCGKGALGIEHLVVMDAEKEIAVIQLPGEKAAKAAIDELKTKLPNVSFVKPSEDGSYDASGEAAAAAADKRSNSSDAKNETHSSSASSAKGGAHR